MKTWWEFVTCQNYEGRDRIGRPDVAFKCARTAKMNWSDGEVGRCAGLDGTGIGEEGVQLLQESVKETEALGIMYVAGISSLRPDRLSHTLMPQQKLHHRYQRGEGLCA